MSASHQIPIAGRRPTTARESHAPSESPVSSTQVDAAAGGTAPRVPVGPADAPAHQGRTAAYWAVTDPPMRLSKTQPPQLRADVLSRSRLLDWLDAKIHRRVVTVVAEAGYGKTTLLADFARRTRIRTIWHQLDDDDGDVVTFMRYLLTACQRVVPDIGETTAGLLRDIGTLATPASVLVDTFVRELSALADQPTVLIFDDVQALDHAPEVQHALREIVARAPDRMTIVLSGRQRPPVALARLRTHGEVAELTADDLRFDHAETETLFRETYGQPLDRESLAALEERTEGWIASLNLVRAAIRDRSDRETRRFIRDLSATEGPLYDYLAEEVVGDLDPDLQSFLMRTSLLVDVEVGPAMDAAEIDRATAVEDIAQAQRLGLLSMGRGRAGHTGAQYHPLVRGFLSARLAREIGLDGVRDVHRRIAAAAEPTDWRRAAHHYAEAGDTGDLHRVLVAATRSIMSAGDYSHAETYISRFPTTDETPWFDIILSRRELRDGHVNDAIMRAERAVAALEASGPDRHLALANLMTVYFFAGEFEKARSLAATVSELAEEPFLASIALGTSALIDVSRGGSIALAEERLRAALALQTDTSGTHYRGVTLLNLAFVYRVQGRATLALGCANEALSAFGDSAASIERSSAHLARAWAYAHQNRPEEAIADLEAARELGHLGIMNEVLAEGADVLGAYIDPEHAEAWLSQGSVDLPSGWVPGDVMLPLSRAENAIRLGALDQASRLLAQAEPFGGSLDVGALSHHAATVAVLAVRRHEPDALRRCQEAVSVSRAQGADYWGAKAQLALAASSGDRGVMSHAVLDIAHRDAALLSAFAEVVAPYLPLLTEEAAAEVAAAAAERPTRWAVALRDVLSTGSADAVVGAAHLLEAVGSRRDVALLREGGRRVRRLPKVDASVRRLARRVAPRVTIHDLGAVSMVVGDTVLAGSTIRRKVLSLVCYLCTRPGMTATREQVLEAIWPDLTPELASNSLNQTVYFLRRVLEPDYRDETTPGYMVSDQDLVWFDTELVKADSQSCLALLRTRMSTESDESVAWLAEHYVGRFALDFEYEDWATTHRDYLHVRYLEAMESAIVRFSATGDYPNALAVAHRVLEVDPAAEGIERTAIRLYRSMGAFAAAAEQYAHYAQLQRAELGVEVPPIDAL